MGLTENQDSMLIINKLSSEMRPASTGGQAIRKIFVDEQFHEMVKLSGFTYRSLGRIL